MYLEWLQTNRQSISKRNVRDKIWSFIMLYRGGKPTENPTYFTISNNLLDNQPFMY